MKAYRVNGLGTFDAKWLNRIVAWALEHGRSVDVETIEVSASFFAEEKAS